MLDKEMRKIKRKLNKLHSDITELQDKQFNMFIYENSSYWLDYKPIERIILKYMIQRIRHIDYKISFQKADIIYTYNSQLEDTAMMQMAEGCKKRGQSTL